MRRKKLAGLVLSMILASQLLVPALAAGTAEGEMGFFGGISEGSYLPKTIEKYVDMGDASTTYTYEEVVFISGDPVVVTGTIDVDIDNEDIDFVNEPEGSYTEEYTVEATNADEGVTLSRSIELTTGYRYIEGTYENQLQKESKLESWDETIATADATYTIDEDTAHFTKSTIESLTPGITYYTTTLSYSGNFLDADDNITNMSVTGNIYGYKQPWSKVESQELEMQISSSDVSLDITLNPKLEASKSIYYNENTPYTMSFGGTYDQRLEREGTLTYTINSYAPSLTSNEKSGSIVLSTPNEIEKLPIPSNLSFIDGNWAEDDLKKMYSLEIFTENPHEGMQYEAITRGDFIKYICRAMDIDISDYEDPDEDAPQIFDDVPYDSSYYPYVMGAYNAKLVNGTGALFNIDDPITREEAFSLCIRVIGLERLGVSGSPTTPFTDDDAISSWAKESIMAGYNIGLISGDDEGKIYPKQWVSKVEAAAILNLLIDYLRDDIGQGF